MTSASPSGGRMLPGGLGNKGEPPPFGPQQRRGQGHEVGVAAGWGREAVECQAVPVAVGTRIDLREDSLPCSVIPSLGGYVTGGCPKVSQWRIFLF